MIYLFAVIFVLVLAFGGVLLRGAPYVPTLEAQAKTALELLELKPGQTLLELGSGDGKVLVLAARAGLTVVGIELNPFLVVVSKFRTRRYKRNIRIIWGDFWRVEWPECDGVFVFLLDRFMPRLDDRMKRVGKPLASFAFKVPNRRPDIEKNGIFLYKYEVSTRN
jgi:SAM-dependent methyltransferase